MSKRRIIFIVLLALTLIYPLTVYYSVQAFLAWRDAVLEGYPIEFRGIIDLPPFTGTVNGFLVMLFGACIAVSWFILFLWRK